jgi:hypothetical protein
MSIDSMENKKIIRKSDFTLSESSQTAIQNIH